MMRTSSAILLASLVFAISPAQQSSAQSSQGPMGWSQNQAVSPFESTVRPANNGWNGSANQSAASSSTIAQPPGYRATTFHYPSTLLEPFEARIRNAGYRPGYPNSQNVPLTPVQPTSVAPSQAQSVPNYAAPQFGQTPYQAPQYQTPPAQQLSNHFHSAGYRQDFYQGQGGGEIILPQPEPQTNTTLPAPGYGQSPYEIHPSHQEYGHSHDRSHGHSHGMQEYGQGYLAHQSWCNGDCQGACNRSYSSGGTPFIESVGEFWDSACEQCGIGDCICRRRGGWFGGVGALAVQRDYESNVYYSYYDGDARSNVLTSNHSDLGTLGGAQASIGRCLSNGWAWMATYWGIVNDSETTSATGQPETRLFGFNWIDYTPQGYATNTAYWWYNAAEAHRVRRENEFHNLELNFFHSLCTPSEGCDPCGVSCASSPWNVQYTVGARFFRFDEFFQYASTVAGGYVYEPRELYYDVDAQNNLIGLQFGGLAQRNFGRCFSFFAGTKLGLYNNHIEHQSRIYGASGYAVINTGSWNGTAYNVSSSKDDIAFLGELDTGIRYQFSNCWRATVGYRLMAATGIALATDQVPLDFSYIPGVRYVDSDGSLLLHGFYAGIEFRR